MDEEICESHAMFVWFRSIRMNDSNRTEASLRQTNENAPYGFLSNVRHILMDTKCTRRIKQSVCWPSVLLVAFHTFAYMKHNYRVEAE